MKPQTHGRPAQQLQGGIHNHMHPMVRLGLFGAVPSAAALAGAKAAVLAQEVITRASARAVLSTYTHRSAKK